MTDSEYKSALIELSNLTDKELLLFTLADEQRINELSYQIETYEKRYFKTPGKFWTAFEIGLN